MPSLFDPNDPLASAYMARNPSSILAIAAQAAARISRNTTPNNDVGGSNNAPGGLTPTMASGPSNPMGRTGVGISSNPQGIYRRGSYNNPMNNMPQISDPVGGNNSTFGNSIVSFAEGGMMSEQGTAVRPGMPPSAGTGRTLPSARFKVDAQPPEGPGMMPSGGPALGAASPAPMTPAQIEQEAQRFVQQHPQEVQKIQEIIALAMQTGELTSDELNMAVQLAKTALARPEAYPQVRQFAIQNGLGTEQDIPQEMDQGLLYVLIVAGKSLAPGGNAMQGQGPAPTQQTKPGSVVPEYSEGGPTGDKAHIAKLHAREYVIPEDAVLFYGTDKFAKMIEKARNPDGNQQQ